ncbi:ESPR-type extended signal peptide-containing protein, partial [Burkholderia ubonensis]|uniref:ESPR-type extended signal peptide-containing protein n=2 Tax=Burkholderia ubonensis TaxID=101571 RepID=UPI0022B759A6
MNKIYRSIRNAMTGASVTVPETANNRRVGGRFSRLRGVLHVFSLLTVAGGGSVVAEEAFAAEYHAGTGSRTTGVSDTAVGGLAAADSGSAPGGDAGDYASAYGQASLAQGGRAVAIGSGAKAGANNTSVTEDTAVGAKSQAVGGQSVAVGTAASASGSGAVALGKSAAASGSGAVAMGRDAQASGNSGFAAGYQANASGAGALALGSGAQGEKDGSVALGSNSLANRGAVSNQADPLSYVGARVSSGAGEVSVGSSSVKRQITNVAAGTADSDAATVGQVKAVKGAVDRNAAATAAA